MHGPISFGLILFIGVAAIAGIAIGSYLPVSQDDEETIATAAHFADPQVAELYDACAESMRASGSKIPSVNRTFCACYSKETATRLGPVEIEGLLATFHDGEAGAAEFVNRLTEAEQRRLIERMNAAGPVVMRRCSKMTLEAAKAAKSSN